MTETRANYRLAEARENSDFVQCQIRTAQAAVVTELESELPAIDAEIALLEDELEREVEYDRLAYRREMARSC